MDSQNAYTGDFQDIFEKLASDITEIGSGFYSRGWLFGTSGNLSAVVRRDPLRLAITGSGLDKGNLAPGQIIEIDESARVVSGEYRPSSETALHISIVNDRKCGAVFHTHSVWGTILSRKYLDKGGIFLEGFEMLKGLDGVRSHDHREWLPILENSQDMDSLAVKVEKLLRENPGMHGFLLSGHGLYSWGATAQEAKRHIEVLEFLMEVNARSGGLD